MSHSKVFGILCHFKNASEYEDIHNELSSIIYKVEKKVRFENLKSLKCDDAVLYYDPLSEVSVEGATFGLDTVGLYNVKLDEKTHSKLCDEDEIITINKLDEELNGAEKEVVDLLKQQAEKEFLKDFSISYINKKIFNRLKEFMEERELECKLGVYIFHLPKEQKPTPFCPVTPEQANNMIKNAVPSESSIANF